MTSKLNVIAREPVAVAAVASIIVWVAAKYGVRVDAQQASEAAGVVLLVAGAFARQLVTPTAKQVTVGPTRTATLNSTGQLEEVYAPQGGVIAKAEGDQIPFEPARDQTVPPKG